jgi:hypothetical protein
MIHDFQKVQDLFTELGIPVEYTTHPQIPGHDVIKIHGSNVALCFTVNFAYAGLLITYTVEGTHFVPPLPFVYKKQGAA